MWLLARTSPVAGDTTGDELSGNILVVEDNLRLRRVVVRQLLNLGHQVQDVESAAAALIILQSDNPVDLLFTDVVMPGGITGMDLAHTARTLRPDLRPWGWCRGCAQRRPPAPPGSRCGAGGARPRRYRRKQSGPAGRHQKRGAGWRHPQSPLDEPGRRDQRG